MSIVFTQLCRVEWIDTDAAGIAHYTAFFRYMERTEHAFLRSLGLSVLVHDDGKHYSWPRVSVACDYSGAVTFEDEVQVELSIDRLGEKSVSYRFRMTHAGRPVAEGHTVAVYCQLSNGAPPKSVPIPVRSAELMQPFVSVTNQNSVEPQRHQGTK